jgi:predicted  nucleic acid-binding Zn-ribbon protein
MMSSKSGNSSKLRSIYKYYSEILSEIDVKTENDFVTKYKNADLQSVIKYLLKWGKLDDNQNPKREEYKNELVKLQNVIIDSPVQVQKDTEVVSDNKDADTTKQKQDHITKQAGYDTINDQLNLLYQEKQILEARIEMLESQLIKVRTADDDIQNNMSRLEQLFRSERTAEDDLDRINEHMNRRRQEYRRLINSVEDNQLVKVIPPKYK